MNPRAEHRTNEFLSLNEIRLMYRQFGELPAQAFRAALGSISPEFGDVNFLLLFFFLNLI